MRRTDVTVFLTLVAAIVTSITMVVPQVTMSQGGGSQVVATGETITWGAEWQLDPERSISVEGYDQLLLWWGTALISVGGAIGPVGGPELRDNLATELIELERGNNDNVSYSLSLYPSSSGTQTATFILVVDNGNATSVAVLWSYVDDFQSAMEAAQAGIGVDGGQLFNGIDPAVMQQQIDAAAGTTSQQVNLTPTQQLAQVEPTELSQTVPPTPTEIGVAPTAGPASGDGGLLQGLNTAPGVETPTPVKTSKAQSTATNANEPFSNSAVLPSNGVQVSYSDDWAKEFQNDYGLQLASVGQPQVFVWLGDANFIPRSFNAAMIAPVALVETVMSTGVELVATVDVDANHKIIALHIDDPRGAFYQIYDVVSGLEDSTGVVLTVYEDDLSAGVDLVSSTVQVDGRPVFADLDQVAPALFPSGGVWWSPHSRHGGWHYGRSSIPGERSEVTNGQRSVETIARSPDNATAPVVFASKKSV